MWLHNYVVKRSILAIYSNTIIPCIDDIDVHANLLILMYWCAHLYSADRGKRIGRINKGGGGGGADPPPMSGGG